MSKKLLVFLKVLSVFIFLYFFLTSIDLMGKAFKLFGKGFAEELLSSCCNPFAGLFIGILATSIIQSSSTTTSLVVGLVGSGVIPLEFSIPVIMGANIGTSITNTLVSLTFVTRRADFQRAFAAATVHDFFNLLSVALYFPIELKFHVIQRSALLLTGLFEGAGGVRFTSPLKAVIKPAVELVKHFLLDTCGVSHVTAGIIMLAAAIVVLILSLTYLVKVMRSLIISKAETAFDKYVFRNDFVALLLGLCITVFVQSSSVTTSLLVPLVAAGIVSLQKCYPVTLGANIGTTCTALLASLATVKAVEGGGANTAGVTAAFAHLVFNILGIMVFYPLRRIPITCAERFAELAARSKRWVVVYIGMVFFLLPLATIFITRKLF